MGSVSDEPFTFASPPLATAVLPRWVNQQGCLYGVSVSFYDLACESRDVLRNQRRDPVSLIESKARERKVHHLDCSTLGCERCRWDMRSRSLRYHMRSHWKRWSSGVRTVTCRWLVSISRWMARVGKPPVLGMGRAKMRKELRVVNEKAIWHKGFFVVACAVNMGVRPSGRVLVSLVPFHGICRTSSLGSDLYRMTFHTRSCFACRCAVCRVWVCCPCRASCLAGARHLFFREAWRAV